MTSRLIKYQILVFPFLFVPLAPGDDLALEAALSSSSRTNVTHTTRTGLCSRGTGSDSLSPRYLFYCLFPFPLPQLGSPSAGLLVSLRHWRELLEVTLSPFFPYQHSPFLRSIPLV